MRINIRKIHPQATGAEIQISRPPSGGDFAGLSQCGATFIISNTWSRGCVFSLTTPAKTLAEEIPVGAMKDFSPPFSVATALTNAILSVSVADQHGTLMTKHLSLRAPETNDTSITIFASRPGIEFSSALFPEPQKGRLEVIKLPEMAFPAFSGTAPFGPVTAWQFSAPFRATDKPAALSDRNARAAWKTAAAHPPTPVTPPLVNLAEVFGKPMAGLTSCASAEIVAEEAKTADLVIGVADSAKVFLNGAEIGHFTGKREWSDGNLTLKGVPLQKGANTLLIEQTSAGNAPLLSVRSRPPTP